MGLQVATSIIYWACRGFAVGLTLLQFFFFKILVQIFIFLGFFLA